MHNIFTPQRSRRIVVYIVVLIVVLCLALIGTRSSYLLYSSTISVSVLDPLYSINITAAPEKYLGGNMDLTCQIYSIVGIDPLETRKVNVTPNGIASQVGVFQAASGTYNLMIDSPSHLKRKMALVLLQDNTSVDFTYAGTQKLYAGEVNDDNWITASDVVQIAGALRNVSGREDLNADGLVNGLDLTMAVANLGRTGDEL